MCYNLNNISIVYDYIYINITDLCYVSINSIQFNYLYIQFLALKLVK